MAGSSPQAMSSSRRWAAARQGCNVRNASWVGGISPLARLRSMVAAVRRRSESQVSSESGLPMPSRYAASGASRGRMRPVPSSSSSAIRSARAQRVQRRPPLQFALVAAAGAGERLRESSAGGADRDAVAGTASRQRPGLVTVGTGSTD
jgi:hypothetical protein